MVKHSLTLITAFIILIFNYSYSYDWEDHYPLLVTGCARSGTGYITKALGACGFELGHEWPKRDGLSSWLFASDCDVAPWGPQPDSIRFDHIFHQVRYPLFVISSVYTTEPPESWAYIMSQILDISPLDSQVVKSAKYWYYWNLKAEKKAEWTYRVEDFENVFEEFGARLGISLDLNAIKTVPKDVNTRGPHTRDFTWDELKVELDSDLYENIRSLAKHYGYILED